MRIEGDWAHLDPLGRLPGGGLQTGLLLDSLYDSLVIIGPDAVVKWSYLAPSPTELPGANLIFDGLEQAAA